ncbi:MAG: class I mannose-6-phosphate isomerase [Deltaproteobacteria bacterium]|nr:class I mannose-6-phosphate isomerase [Deltaproteobacteria bacterium]
MDLRPLLLRPDNFTPPTRTPWGGRKILDRFKRGVALDPGRAAYPVVGESWEISVEPDFPSLADDTGRRLDAVLAASPVEWLGREGVARHGPSTPLLVKLLDAADDLSVQVHPANDHAGLEADESGKPEAWYVVDRDPGAGIYLGLQDGVGRESAARTLASGGDLGEMLHFVPVEPGDFFAIGPGVVHAVGKGVTLVEPQLVLPGKRGVTYRVWDWNRRYDASGRLDAAGELRPLHSSKAHAVIAWDGPRGDDFIESARLSPELVESSGSAKRERWPSSPSVPIAVERVSGSGALALSTGDRLWGLTVLAGEVRVASSLTVGIGRSAVVPAALGTVRLDLGGADAILASAI